MVVCDENLGRDAITEYQLKKHLILKNYQYLFTNVNFIQEEHTK